ncbi:leucine rich repeat lipoprotein [Nitzschia inconspicua]|uniref:Leucine rich repeat lipoprotein n=1 Tax=Nitzschia inconspicua TaxID=303405 RepID=A0A9K3M4K5_9STRA|nr:leucine rich repeat lipoprotein [Nitzschia inconspicua]
MAENRRKLQSSTNDDGSNHPIKKQKTRKVLTALTFPYDRNKSQLMIDAEDFENIQDIIGLRIAGGTPIEQALSRVASISDCSDQYRVTGLKIRDYGTTETFWYTQPHLPISLCNLDALHYIYIYGTQIETFFSEDDDADYPKVIPNLDCLFLQSMPRLQSLPSNLGSFTKLKNLELTELPINALPDSLSSLGGSLKTLKITYCEDLTSLPDGFGQLHSLQHLETNGTPIQQLPESFGNLKRLLNLEMEFQHLTQLPPDFTILTSLCTLKTGHGNGLWDLSIWNKAIVPLEVKTITGTLGEYKLFKELFSNFSELSRFRLACGAGQILKFYFDEIPGLQQLEHLDLVGCSLLKPAKSLQDPTPIRNLKSISLYKIKEGVELLSEIRAPLLERLHFEYCSSMDDVMFGNFCKNWLPHLKNLQFLRICHCEIANIQPEHLQHLEETKVDSIGIHCCPIFAFPLDKLDSKLLPLVRHCQFLFDISNHSVPANVAYQLCLNAMRGHVLGGQRICSKGLWPLIFENAVKGRKCVQCWNWWKQFQAEMIYVLLKERAITELYG